MKNSRGYMIGGGLLVLLGIVLLLQNFGIVPFAIQLFWALAFAAGGVVFLAFFVADRARNWWAIIPSFALLGLSGLMLFTLVFPGLEVFGVTLFLGAIALAFWIIYLNNRENWWAIIPGGTMLTLALVTALSNSGNGFAVGGLFFLGLAATFLVVNFVPTPQGRMTWAIIPASILGVMGLLLVATLGNLINYIWPLVLIVGGGFLILRAMNRARDSERM